MGRDLEQPVNSNLENTSNKLDNEAKSNFIGVNDLNVDIPAEFLSSVANALANGGIRTVVITVGFKIVYNTPDTVGKLAIGIASVAFNAGTIIAKIIGGLVNYIKKAEYIDSDKSSFMSLPNESSGNSAIDLLNILQYFHTLEFFFVLCLGFYFIIMKLDWGKTNILIEKYIPLKAQKFLIWYIKSLKLSVNFLFISF